MITYTITSAVITGGTSIPTSASSVDLPVGAALGWLSVFFFPFNNHHTEIFQNPHRKARKTQCH